MQELLTSRFNKGPEQQSKMAHLAERSSGGTLSSFSGVFRVVPLAEVEEENLRDLLTHFSKEEQEIGADLKSLSAITSEVKAINNQAAILHGERIKRAQDILKKYRDGAFTHWLMATYGNRQTPYNFLQYYELYTSVPKLLQGKIDQMPRQAVYTLASRSAPHEEKIPIIAEYKGETKKQLLQIIRQKFPLEDRDKRRAPLSTQLLQQLKEIEKECKGKQFKPSAPQKEALLEVLQSIQKTITTLL